MSVEQIDSGPDPADQAAAEAQAAWEAVVQTHTTEAEQAERAAGQAADRVELMQHRNALYTDVGHMAMTGRTFNDRISGNEADERMNQFAALHGVLPRGVAPGTVIDPLDLTTKEGRAIELKIRSSGTVNVGREFVASPTQDGESATPRSKGERKAVEKILKTGSAAMEQKVIAQRQAMTFNATGRPRKAPEAARPYVQKRTGAAPLPDRYVREKVAQAIFGDLEGEVIPVVSSQERKDFKKYGAATMPGMTKKEKRDAKKLVKRDVKAHVITKHEGKQAKTAIDAIPGKAGKKDPGRVKLITPRPRKRELDITIPRFVKTHKKLRHATEQPFRARFRSVSENNNYAKMQEEAIKANQHRDRLMELQNRGPIFHDDLADRIQAVRDDAAAEATDRRRELSSFDLPPRDPNAIRDVAALENVPLHLLSEQPGNPEGIPWVPTKAEFTANNIDASALEVLLGLHRTDREVSMVGTHVVRGKSLNGTRYKEMSKAAFVRDMSLLGYKKEDSEKKYDGLVRDKIIREPNDKEKARNDDIAAVYEIMAEPAVLRAQLAVAQAHAAETMQATPDAWRFGVKYLLGATRKDSEHNVPFEVMSQESFTAALARRGIPTEEAERVHNMMVQNGMLKKKERLNTDGQATKSTYAVRASKEQLEAMLSRMGA